MLNDSLNNRETDAAAREFRAVQPLESAEQLFNIFHVEAASVIADKVGCCSILMSLPEFDFCRRFVRGELPCVAQQIFQHHPQEERIAVNYCLAIDDVLDGA